MSDENKPLVFDGDKISKELREHGIEPIDAEWIVGIASQIIDLLWHSREARMVRYPSRAIDASAEVLAIAFCLRSMTGGSGGSDVWKKHMDLIFHVVDVVYRDGQPVPLPPAASGPPKHVC
jgi:hypothetical protein